MWAVSLLCAADIGRVLEAVALAARCEAHPIDAPRLAAAQMEQLSLLRCVFGNPFRPVAVDPSWLTWQGGTVVRLSQVAYHERQLPLGALDGACLAVLADALEVAGCTRSEILNHLHEPGPHVRGCHVLDALLGRP
jgi:hypothetical protein